MSTPAHQAMELRTRYLVLLILAEGPKSGYELLKTIRSLLPEIGRGVSPGTLYPLLRSLEEEGCIEAYEERSGARRRKMYRLTRKGAEALLAMAARGLNVVEALLRLHLRATERLRENPRSIPNPQLLEEVVRRLEAIEEATRQLRVRLMEALRHVRVEGEPVM